MQRCGIRHLVVSECAMHNPVMQCITLSCCVFGGGDLCRIPEVGLSWCFPLTPSPAHCTKNISIRLYKIIYIDIIYVDD